MSYTQIELTGPEKQKEVLWIPVPEKKAKVGEKIHRRGEEWTISQVCTTLDREHIPSGQKIIDEAYFQVETQYYLVI